MIQTGLPTCANATATVGVVRIAFDFDQPTIFDVPHDSAHRAAQLAHARNLFRVGVFIEIGPTVGVFHRRFPLWRICVLVFRSL